MHRRYVVLDVFTRSVLAGNPLAVVLDAEGLDDSRMQAIAREFNLSETVFVLPPESPRHRAALRIFTPARELPFAGHPTVGTAVLLALRDRPDAADAHAFGLEEKVGIVPCVTEILDARSGRARFRLPRLPLPWGIAPDAAACARALGLEAADIGFDRHVPSQHGAGVPYTLIPVSSLDALARACPSASFGAAIGGGDHPAAYIYARDPAHGGLSFRARMFAPELGIVEDPATGSAAAAFAGTLMEFEPLGSGSHEIRIGQGYEMGRPSEIALQMLIESGELTAVEIGGEAVVVAEGTLAL